MPVKLPAGFVVKGTFFMKKVLSVCIVACALVFNLIGFVGVASAHTAVCLNP